MKFLLYLVYDLFEVTIGTNEKSIDVTSNSTIMMLYCIFMYVFMIIKMYHIQIFISGENVDIYFEGRSKENLEVAFYDNSETSEENYSEILEANFKAKSVPEEKSPNVSHSKFWNYVMKANDNKNKMEIIQTWEGEECDPEQYFDTVEIRAHFPFINTSRRLTLHFCGGTLLNRFWVLTAAHCWNSTLKLQVWLSHSGIDMIESPVSQFVAHPDYNEEEHINDIALLLLENSVDITDFVKYVKIPTPKRNNAPKDYCSKGLLKTWGETQYPIANEKLQCTNVTIIDSRFCNSKNPEKIICVNSSTTDICVGDTGGPLMCSTNIQIGIVPWSSNVCEPSHRAFIRIDEYLDFIKNTFESIG